MLLGDGIIPDTLTEGGSGYNSLSAEMPDAPPERYEAGTLATPAIAGLCEGIRYIKRVGIDRLHSQAVALCSRLQAGLEGIDGITVYAPHCAGSVLLFSSLSHSADALGERLNAQGICVRTGYHCAPLAHKTLQTPKGGALRVSPSAFNTTAEMDTLVNLIRASCSSDQ